MTKLPLKYPKGLHWYLLYLPNYMLYLVWLLLLVSIVAYPLWQNWTIHQRISALKQTLVELTSLEHKQQQILQLLQQRVSEGRDSQKNTQKLDKLHQDLTELSSEQAFTFDMQMSNKDLLRVDLRLHIAFQSFIEHFDLLFQSILANWAISSIQIERNPDPDSHGLLSISIHLFSEELR
ncbi:hypothetical protein QV08_04185 [Gallibacterium salpingitidis]|uniref:hypothetical protein n=1 Tax=Gallibacterium salpingitidis TaxID=505341 RepID=UPI000804AA27|nr:hypothetical protein [Gallibacterium salpingitidis]OBX08415.1 hypothetical protein QV08_04185 [Gallibacterium salpingitidis]WKS99147.1 hypothetical protein NYR30_10405 [Gallibacterium salpingitidis]